MNPTYHEKINECEYTVFKYDVNLSGLVLHTSCWDVVMLRFYDDIKDIYATWLNNNRPDIYIRVIVDLGNDKEVTFNFEPDLGEKFLEDIGKLSPITMT